jgi:tetratricopeptide (TPR) repeat protein
VGHAAEIYVSTLGELCAALAAAGAGPPSAWVVADVSLGGWRGYQVATELSAELALAPPPKRSLELAQSVTSCAGLIGNGIDADSRGDGSTLTAIDAAERVVAALPLAGATTVVVLAPGRGREWEPEDLLFVRVLAHRLITGRLVVVYSEPPPSRAVAGGGSLLGLVPGIVEPEVADALADAGAAPTGSLPLREGRLLVAPECRPSPDLSRLEYDRLAAGAGGIGWLKAYAQCLGNNVFVDPSFLAAEAWERFAEGGSGVALRLLERAAACATDLVERAIAECEAQGIRIGTSRFAGAAAVPEPSEAVPAELRRLLLFGRGYALVMTGDVERGLPLLERARELFDGAADDRELLYLQNIAALGRFKSGDAKGALELERDIARRAARLPRPDWRLGFVNSLNVARLYRHLGDTDAAQDAYEGAFAFADGSRSESEAVYVNVSLARLAAERDRHGEAFLSWIRAALHWAAAASPEALGRRVVRAVTGHAEQSPQALVGEVSEALFRELAEAAERSRRFDPVDVARWRGAARDQAPTPAFVRARPDGAPEPLVPTTAVGGPGWGLIAARGAAGQNGVHGEARWPLRALLVELLTSMTRGLDLLDADALLVDDRLGQELPRSLGELLESALRLGASRVSFEGLEPLELDDPPRLEACLTVRRGPAVETITCAAAGEVVVRLRRADEEVTYSGELAAVIRVLADAELTVAALAARLELPEAGLLGRLRTLEAHRVVYLSSSEESCTKAGISWPSRASLLAP